MRLIDVDHFIATLDTVVQKHESVLWQKIAETMKYMIEVESEMFSVEIIRCHECKHMQEDKLFGQCWCNGNEVKPDHFCGYAERKEDE